MHRPLVAMGVLLLSGFVAYAQEQLPLPFPFNRIPTQIHVVIQASAEQVKKAALAMFVRKGYSLDSDKALQEVPEMMKKTAFRISKPFTGEETDAYNTAHWTNPPVSDCRHVHAFLFSPEHLATNVTMVSEMVCHRDGIWLFRDISEKEMQSMQNTLANLKANIEAVNKRR